MAPSPPATPPLLRDVTLVAMLVAVVATMAAHAHVRGGGSIHSVVAVAMAAPVATDCGVEPVDARVECLRRSIRVTLRSGGELQWALSQINSRARHDPLLAARCHMLLHEEGRAWRGGLGPGAIRHDGKDCAAGFLHGWMLAHLGAGGQLERSTVDSWCGAAETPLERADCEHGMGHVLVRNLGGDLRAAIVRCRALGDEARRRNCASGAFMENRAGGRGRDGAAASATWRAGRPWQPCASATPADLHDVCAAWAVRDVAPARRLSWCAALPASVDARACRIAVGAVAPVGAEAGTCGDDAACWYGRGFAWAMLDAGDAGADATTRCGAAAAAALQRACMSGSRFRRAAARPGSAHIAVAYA